MYIYVCTCHLGYCPRNDVPHVSYINIYYALAHIHFQGKTEKTKDPGTLDHDESKHSTKWKEVGAFCRQIISYLHHH